MNYTVSVELPSFDYQIDPQAMAETIAEGMRDFYAQQLNAGKQPDGSALPPNAEGKPLGKGDGSIVRGWKAYGLRASKLVGRAVTEPNQEGKWAIIIRRLRRRGVKFQGTRGAAAEALARMISDEVTRQHKRAARGSTR